MESGNKPQDTPNWVAPKKKGKGAPPKKGKGKKYGENSPEPSIWKKKKDIPQRKKY